MCQWDETGHYGTRISYEMGAYGDYQRWFENGREGVLVVELGGLEPPTSSLQRMRSP